MLENHRVTVCVIVLLETVKLQLRPRKQVFREPSSLVTFSHPFQRPSSSLYRSPLSVPLHPSSGGLSYDMSMET